MKKIAIAIIGILVALYLAVYGPWRSGGQREKDSTVSLNAAQGDNSPATDARDIKQSVKDNQQPVKEVKQRVTDKRVAKRQGKSANRSMTGMRHNGKREDARSKSLVVETRADYGANGCVTSLCEGRELQVVETRGVEQLTIDVLQPVEDVEAVYVDVQELFIEPTGVEYVEGASVWAPARELYLAAPERQECPTPYEVRVEPGLQ